MSMITRKLLFQSKCLLGRIAICFFFLSFYLERELRKDIREKRRKEWQDEFRELHRVRGCCLSDATSCSQSHSKLMVFAFHWSFTNFKTETVLFTQYHSASSQLSSFFFLQTKSFGVSSKIPKTMKTFFTKKKSQFRFMLHATRAIQITKYVRCFDGLVK